jgi:Uma2 family endonuclease
MVDSLIAPPVERTESSVEPSVEGSVQRSITFDEFLVEYAEQHAEWIDGEVIIVANNTEHNTILQFLTVLLTLFLGFAKLGRLIIAGVPMKTAAIKAAREPDLLILLTANQSRIKTNYVDGAADIAIEIVSPESRGRDLDTKFKEYAAGGVGEYWIFDPETESADMYALTERDGKPAYVRLPRDGEGRLISKLLPSFALDPALIWEGNRPDELELVKLTARMAGVTLE